MNSWSNWVQLSEENIKKVPKDAKGIYVIRKKSNIKSSDIIYIGSAGTGKQGVGHRLQNLMKGLKKSKKSASNNHCASPTIRRYIKDGLEFSWLECSKAPDGIEKALLLGFFVSTGELPECNKRF